MPEPAAFSPIVAEAAIETKIARATMVIGTLPVGEGAEVDSNL